ncbi:MAG: hydrolase [Pirellulaceae bacterium]|nr:hydrolase [Pirellulaceae bacterium]
MSLTLDRLRLPDALLLVVDVQGKLARMMDQSESVIRQLQILIDGCRLLELPVVWAEQLPDKLGATLPEIADRLQGLQPHIKYSFGCCGDEALYREIQATGRRQVILCGIEAHVCVWQTAFTLRQDGYQVHLICDAVSSRSAVNREIGVQRMAASGVHLSCVELALFELMVDARHPKFRDVTKLLK